MPNFENKYIHVVVCSPGDKLLKKKKKKHFGDFLPLHPYNSRLRSKSFSKALTVNFKIQVKETL